MPSLNTPQRIFLATIGVAIILFQLYRFADDGIEGTGWVFTFLVAALLLLPAVGLLSKPKALHPLPMKPNSSEERLSRAKQRIENLVSRATERAAVLHRRLPILFDFPPLQAPEFQRINAFMIDSWLQYCIAFTGCLSLMAEYKRNPRFMTQPDYRVVWQMLVNEIAKAEAIMTARHGLHDKFDIERSVQWATRDMNEAELAMKKFIDNLAKSVPEPDAPLIGFLMEKLHAPEQSRQSLSQGIEKFARETLHQFAAIAT
ncbi:MAG: hypothetical protein KIT07_01240 [Anaerolineales bacterium]|nr:hypothetical protein [Anaerolineales bacterium]